ncbi:LOW QUALITY PROTEIN: cell envelope-associated transcriptional attenuator LytR-CpsA-Psr [Geomicrobium sp. JCM 19038]|nr:LOW QUALITY PROTEIN: cell envelope-associated transcriptional attenuator LytR-CpsA-Psr [Geomicrobium sp. JCM 19038]
MKKTYLILGAIMATLALCIAGFLFYSYGALTKTTDDIYRPIERTHPSVHRPEPALVEEHDPISFLLLGLDAEDETLGRTDTLIVATVNQTTSSIQMLSIPRDTLTEIIGHNTIDKINHAHAFGGLIMTVETVESLLDIPIDYVVTINMQGFTDLIDAVDGITVTNSFSFEYGGFEFLEGPTELSGEEALAYVRMRYEDPLGDSGRNIRQRQVIESFLKEIVQFPSISKINEIFTTVRDNVETNLTLSDMIDLFAYEPSRHHIEQHTLQGTGTYKDGIYYLLVSDEELEKQSNKLKKHLEL